MAHLTIPVSKIDNKVLRRSLIVTVFPLFVAWNIIGTVCVLAPLFVLGSVAEYVSRTIRDAREVW